jgi:hypothetical protein
MAARKKAPVAKATENNSETPDNEVGAMQAQIAYQMRELFKLAEKQGIKLEDIFEKPPTTVTTVLQGTAVAVPVAVDVKQKPGTYIVDQQGKPTGATIPWTKQDLDPEDTVEFVPIPVPGLVYPFMDENGYQKIRLDVNNLVCWLTCGVPNKVNRFFWNVYDNSLQGYRELERFKRNGPAWAPWGARGPDGGPAWLYVPQAATFGMDDRGHSLRIGGPTPLDLTEVQPAEAPAESGK